MSICLSQYNPFPSVFRLKTKKMFDEKYTKKDVAQFKLIAASLLCAKERLVRITPLFCVTCCGTALHPLSLDYGEPGQTSFSVSQ